MLPPSQMPVPEPINHQITARSQPPGLHASTPFSHSLPPTIQPEVHRTVQPAAHTSLNNTLARASYEVDRMLHGNRVVTNERADLAALYNSQAYMARQQQYPATIQQMYDINWQQQLRREPVYDRESAELPSKVMN